MEEWDSTGRENNIIQRWINEPGVQFVEEG